VINDETSYHLPGVLGRGDLALRRWRWLELALAACNARWTPAPEPAHRPMRRRR